jgi:predicted nucleic acid-binding protein
MILLLDTDILIDVLRRHPPALAWFHGLATLPAVAGLAVIEAIQGCRNAGEVRAVHALVRPLHIAWPAGADFDRALRDFSALSLSHGLGLLDSLIGACALGLGATLCTFNGKHYGMIVGLQLLEPYAR